MTHTAFLFLSLLLISSSANALVSLSLSEDKVPLGTAVQLTIQSDKEINPYTLSSEISKKAKIRGQSSSTNIQITNNSKTSLYSLSFTIFPLSEGETVFGPFDVNQEQTNSVTLTVLPPQQIANNSLEIKNKQDSNSTLASKFIFQAEVNPKTIYEGQTGIYKLKFFDPVHIYNINIQPPKSHLFSFSKLNQDTVKQEKIDEKIGRLYQSYFSFTPLKTGRYQIAPAEFSGAVPSKNNKNDINSFFDISFNDRFLISPFQSETPVYFQSNPIEIEVKEKPSDWTGWWLPSTNVSLEQEFKIPDQIHLGEAIERRIILKASQIESSKLPTLSHPGSSEYTFFANPEKRFTTFENEEIVGVEMQEFLIIPQTEGVIKIPPLSIKYFNTITEEEQTITLEGKEITVLPALLNKANIKEETPPPPQIKEPAQEKPLKAKNNPFLFVYLSGLAVFGLLIMGLFLILRHKKKKRFSPIENMQEEDLSPKKKKPLPDLYPF